MELKPTYSKNGEKRSYYLGEDGNEYFIYHDERTGYTIREMNKDDVISWYDTMRVQKGQQIYPLERVINLARVSQKVEKMTGESLEKTMLILNPNNEIIGEMDFTEKKAKANLEVYLKDEMTVKLKGRKIVELIKRMNTSEFLYDEIWMENAQQGLVRIV